MSLTRRALRARKEPNLTGMHLNDSIRNINITVSNSGCQSLGCVLQITTIWTDQRLFDNWRYVK
ncbi:hypothetical protein PUN28_002862 [Cardiocondyla obscurior]|uniref:Uncharacterized protein n=1 Tax=Cardiocondyla obscurior TaxID=286306 RepID=A0AAW2GWJ1_9HYME